MTDKAMKAIEGGRRKKLILAGCLLLLFNSCSLANAQDNNFDQYISHFNYQERRDMKIGSEELVRLITEKKVQFIDIRFKEEFEVWRMGFGINIPLNELPGRLNELDKNRLIVTACPHKDRATIAMVYLKTKGFRVRYLEDGLTGLAEYLRGDRAKDFLKRDAGRNE